MNFKNLQMTVSKVVPKLDGKSPKDMNINAPASGVVFNKIGIILGKNCHLAKAFEQIGLFA